MKRPLFLPRLVPHLYHADEPACPKHGALYVRARSPLAYTERNGHQDFDFAVIGTGGLLKSYSMRGRIFPPETLAMMAMYSEEIRRTAKKLKAGQFLVQLDVSPLTKVATSTEFPSYYHGDPALLVNIIIMCLKNRFSFPFQTELVI